MKKIFLSLAIATTVLAANAQDLMSKKGFPILPENGDWAVGINANPFFEYVGNMFNNSTSNSAPSWDYTGSHPLVITGLMVKDGGKAIRAKARITFGSKTGTAAPDTSSGSLKDSTNSTFSIVLGLGMQYSRGKGRLHGIYGYEGLISFGNDPGEGTTKFTYNGTTPVGATTERKDGSGFGIGVRGFIGAEYFFAPKMSLSAEYGWGITFDSKGAGSVTVEGSGSHDTGKQSAFGVNVDNGLGFINFNFYF